MSVELKLNFNDFSSCRLLIVEDEPKLMEFLVARMKEEKFSVFTCESYRSLEQLLEFPNKRFDVIILDRLLHGKDSSELLARIKMEMPDIKVLILSAINTAREKAILLDLGADDYVAKPFDGDELVARIRVLLRRNQVKVSLGNVSLNSHSRTMVVGSHEVALPNKEFVLLRTLLQAPRKVFNKAFLYERVWEMSAQVESNVVETTINKIRRRLIEVGATVEIKNSRNTGYWVEE